MDIRIEHVQILFHPEMVMDRVHRITASAIRAGAKLLHKSAQNAIRVSEYPSNPGKAPHTRNGNRLKLAIRSSVDEEHLTATVGLSPSLGSKRVLSGIAALHEYGGSIPTGIEPYGIGDYGPVRFVKPKLSAKQRTKDGALGRQYMFAILRTAKQAEAANRFRSEFYGAPKAKADYPERPFLRPALKKAMKSVYRKLGINN